LAIRAPQAALGFDGQGFLKDRFTARTPEHPQLACQHMHFGFVQEVGKVDRVKGAVGVIMRISFRVSGMGHLLSLRERYLLYGADTRRDPMQFFVAATGGALRQGQPQRLAINEVTEETTRRRDPTCCSPRDHVTQWDQPSRYPCRWSQRTSSR
jgi:hypothetical protein